MYIIHVLCLAITLYTQNAKNDFPLHLPFLSHVPSVILKRAVHASVHPVVVSLVESVITSTIAQNEQYSEI